MTGTMRKENGGNVSSRLWGVPVLVCLTLGLGACMNGQSAPPQQENAPAPPAAPSASDLPVFMEAPLGAQVTVPPAAPRAGVPTPTGARVVYVPIVVSTPADGMDAARPDTAGQGALPGAAPAGDPPVSGVRETADRQASPGAAVAAQPASPASPGGAASATGSVAAQTRPAAIVRVPAWNPQGQKAASTEPSPAPRQEARVAPSAPPKSMPEAPVATVSVPVTRTPASESAPVAAPAAPVQAPAAPPSVPAWDPHGQPIASAPAAVPPRPATASAPAVPVSPPAAPARASVPPATSRAATAPARPTAETAYKAALATYQAKRFEESERAFDAFLRDYPNSKLAPNALYWKGESLYSRRLYPEAIFVFKDVTARYPKHHKASDALLKAGMAYGRMNDEDNARLHYQVLLEDYPSSPAARRARELHLLK